MSVAAEMAGCDDLDALQDVAIRQYSGFEDKKEEIHQRLRGNLKIVKGASKVPSVIGENGRDVDESEILMQDLEKIESAMTEIEFQYERRRMEIMGVDDYREELSFRAKLLRDKRYVEHQGSVVIDEVSFEDNSDITNELEDLADVRDELSREQFVEYYLAAANKQFSLHSLRETIFRSEKWDWDEDQIRREVQRVKQGLLESIFPQVSEGSNHSAIRLLDNMSTDRQEAVEELSSYLDDIQKRNDFKKRFKATNVEVKKAWLRSRPPAIKEVRADIASYNKIVDDLESQVRTGNAEALVKAGQMVNQAEIAFKQQRKSEIMRMLGEDSSVRELMAMVPYGQVEIVTKEELVRLQPSAGAAQNMCIVFNKARTYSKLYIAYDSYLEADSFNFKYADVARDLEEEIMHYKLNGTGRNDEEKAYIEENRKMFEQFLAEARATDEFREIVDIYTAKPGVPLNFQGKSIDQLSDQDLEEIFEEVLNANLRGKLDDRSNALMNRLISNSAYGSALRDRLTALPHTPQEFDERVLFSQDQGENGEASLDDIKKTTPTINEVRSTFNEAENVALTYRKLAKEHGGGAPLGLYKFLKSILPAARADVERFEDAWQSGSKTEEEERMYLKNLQEAQGIASNFRSKMKDNLNNLKNEIRKIKDADQGFLSTWWDQFKKQRISFNTLIKLVKEGWEKYKENRDNEEGLAGMFLFSRIFGGTQIGASFNVQIGKYWGGIYSGWQEYYKNNGLGTCLGGLEKADTDQHLAAVLETLGETYGSVSFEDKRVWRALARVKKVQITSVERAKEVYDSIMGAGAADRLISKNNSGRSTAIEQGKKEVFSFRGNRLKEELDTAIANMDKGDTGKVFKGRYEGLILGAMEQGLGDPYMMFHYLVKGYSRGIFNYDQIVDFSRNHKGKIGLLAYLQALADKHRDGILYKGGKTEIDYIADLQWDGGSGTAEFMKWANNVAPADAATITTLQNIAQAYNQQDPDIFYANVPFYPKGDLLRFLDLDASLSPKLKPRHYANIYSVFAVAGVCVDAGRFEVMLRNWHEFDQKFEHGEQGIRTVKIDPYYENALADQGGKTLKEYRTVLREAWRRYESSGIDAAQNYLKGVSGSLGISAYAA